MNVFKMFIMKIEVIRLFFLLCIWTLTGLGVNAQSMYPAFPSSIYYNVDTTAIKLGKELVLKKSYTTEELARVFDGSWDPDSAVLATPYEEVPCTMVGRIALPLLEINNPELIRAVSEIIDKTLTEGYSVSPDTVISRGVVFMIHFFRDRNSQTKPIVVGIDVLSNYYLGASFKYIKRDHSDSNIFCCYYQGILGIVTFSEDLDDVPFEQLFMETEQNVTLHLYKKQMLKIITEDSYSPTRDVHSNNYGLYRWYVLEGNKLVTSD